MKKTIAFILALLLAGSVLPAGAEVIDSVLLSGGTLTISGTLPENAEEDITVSILAENIYWTTQAASLSGNPLAKSLEDYKQGENIFDYLAWLGQLSAEAGENYTLTIPGYAGPADPEIRFRICDGNYYFYSSRELEAVNSAATAQEIENAYRASSFLWSAISGTYGKLTEELKNSFWNACLNYRNALKGAKFSVFADAAAAAEPCYFMAKLNLCTDRTGLENLYSEFKTEGKDTNSYDIYFSSGVFSRNDGVVYMSEAQKDALSLNILEDKAEFVNAGDFVDSFNEKIVLYAVRSSLSKELVADVLDKAELLKDELSDYRKLDKAGRLKVAGLVNNEGPYDTISDLANAVSDFCEEISDDNEKSFGGSKGGGSGGSAVSLSGGITANANAIEKTCHFTDLDKAGWAKEAISALCLSGIVNGREETIFDPMGMVSRAEFIKMLVLATGGADSGAIADFSDSKMGDWHYIYIATAVKRGLINGIGDGKFGTDTTITRQDMAVILARALGADLSGTESGFSDDAQISNYAKGAVGFVREKGIMNGMGDNRFEPLTQVTRAQAAKVIYEIMKGGAE